MSKLDVKSPTQLAKTMDELSDDIPLPSELTDRQRRIVKYRQRGMTQRAIAQVENVSQPMISQEMKAIREAFREQGEQIDQEVVVGETMNLFQELEHRGWELYHKSMEAGKLGDGNKALNTIMSARERSIKLLMDLGLMKRAKIEHEHNVTLPPLMKQWQDGEVDQTGIVTRVIDTQLSALDEPTPPQLESGDEEDVEDAEYEES